MFLWPWLGPPMKTLCTSGFVDEVMFSFEHYVIFGRSSQGGGTSWTSNKCSVLELCEWTDRQTDILIAIVCASVAEPGVVCSNGMTRCFSGTRPNTTACAKLSYNRDRSGHQTSYLSTRASANLHRQILCRGGSKRRNGGRGGGTTRIRGLATTGPELKVLLSVNGHLR